MQRARAAWLASLVGALLALVPSPLVSAHAGLESSVPEPSSVLEEGPESIVLNFDEPVEVGTASIQLYDQNRQKLQMGDVTGAVDDSSTILAAAPEIGDGTFAVVWRVTSIDGHVVDGAFTFQVGTGSSVDANALLDDVTTGLTADPIVQWVGGIARFAGFLGVALLLGGGLFLLGAPIALLSGSGARRLLVAGWVLSITGTVVTFGSQAAEVVGGSLADMVSPSAWHLLAGTRAGRALLVRMAATVALGVLLLAVRHRSTVWWKTIAITAAVFMLISFPAAGHAAAQTPELLWTAVDALHLAGVVGWLGGLLLLCTVGRRWGNGDDHDGDSMVQRFSRVATVAVPIIIVTGVAQTLQLAGGLGDLTTTRWGQVLLVKVAVVVVLVTIAGVSRWMLQQSGSSAIHRTVLAEAVLGVGVLALAASLVGLPPEVTAQAQVFSTALTEAGVIVDVTLTPGLVGQNEVHVIVTPQGGSLQPVSDLTGRMLLPSKGALAVPIAFTAIGPNHYSGLVTLPVDGLWTMELDVVPTPGNTLSLTTDVPIG